MTSLVADNLEYIILGTDSHYYHKSWDAPIGQSDDGKDHWKPSQSEWTDIGGHFITEPVVCRWDTDFFVIGLDAASSLQYKRYNGTTKTWYSQDWTLIGTKLEKWLTKPGTAVAYPAWIELMIIGRDGGMYQFWFNGSSWSGSGALSQDILFKTQPTMTNFVDERFDIFCTSVNGKLYHKWWLKSYGWYPSGTYEELGGPFHSQAEAISKEPGTIDLLVVGHDGKLYHRFYDGSWKEWEALDGLWKGVPELVSFEVGRLDAFVIDHSGNVVHKVNQAGDGWTSSEIVAGPTISDRVTATSWGPGRIDLEVVKEDLKVWHKTYERGIGWVESEIGYTPSDPETYDIGGVTRYRVGTHS